MARMVILVAAVLAIGAAAQAEGQAAGPEIILRVYNYAHVSDRTRTAAEAETSRILQAAGLQAHWEECPTTPQEKETMPGCRMPWQPNIYSLRLMAVAQAVVPVGQEKSLHAMGDAFPCMQAEACMARIFWDRVKQNAGAETPEATLLGRVMAHEIGHMLLGPAHTSGGIMQGFWSQRELSFMARNRMVFDGEQAGRMYIRLAAGETGNVIKAAE